MYSHQGSGLHESIAKLGISRMRTVTEGFVLGPATTAEGHPIAYFVGAPVSADEPDASAHPQGTAALERGILDDTD